MPTIQYFLTADSAIQEAESNKYSLIGIFENFNIPQEQESIVVPSFVIFSRIKNTRNTTRVDVIIKNPDGTELSKIHIPTEPTKHEQLTIAAIVQGIQFSVPGRYAVEIKINDNPVAPLDNQFLTVVKL